MSKQKKVAQPGDHIALHELHLGDVDGLGDKTVIGVGEPVPDGTFGPDELEALVAKKAIQAPPKSAKQVRAEAEAGASRDALDDITGTAGDDGLGDGDGGEEGGEAASSPPAAKPSGAKAVKTARRR